MSTPTLRRRLLTAVPLVPLLLPAACGGTRTGTDPAAVTVGGVTVNIGPDQHRVRADKIEAIAALVPQAIRAKGELVVGTTVRGQPPLSFLATYDTTAIGVEPDIAQLVADVLGLRLSLDKTSWENLFLAVRSGKDDVGFSNITVTEERKDSYDFATYRVDQLAWETAKDSPITKIDQPADIAGLTVSVASGTNQEKILLDWDAQNKAAGRKPVTIQYYQNGADYYLALRSGRIAAYLGPHPAAAYHAAVSGDTRIVGTYSGGGATVPGRIAVMTRKDNGLVKALNQALNTVIANGRYAEVLKRWGLANEAVPESVINPPGLPRQ